MYKFKVLEFEEVVPRSKINPKARSGHRIVADSRGDLYSFGGFNVNIPSDDRELSEEPEWQIYKPLFQELWKFNWRSNSWQKLRATGDVPDKLVSHCMCYLNNQIIIYGGTGLPYGENSSNKLTIYDIERNHWEVIEPSPNSTRPQAMYGQACACDAETGTIYIVGGTNGSSYSLDVHKFELPTKKWTLLYKSYEIDYDPGCRYRHEITLYNNKLYVFGGSTSIRYYSFDALPVFNIETNNWSYSKTKPQYINKRRVYPSARKCHSLVVIGNDCYISGGTNGLKVFSDLWHINLDKLQWTRLSNSVPNPVYFHAASYSLSCKISIFGGVETTKGDIRNNKLTTIWLKVPTLKNMCLAAVNHYITNKTFDGKLARATGVHDALEMADSLI